MRLGPTHFVSHLGPFLELVSGKNTRRWATQFYAGLRNAMLSVALPTM
jgi:hypothetical protein